VKSDLAFLPGFYIYIPLPNVKNQIQRLSDRLISTIGGIHFYLRRAPWQARGPCRLGKFFAGRISTAQLSPIAFLSTV
jgi:hypothetical protein